MSTLTPRCGGHRQYGSNSGSVKARLANARNFPIAGISPGITLHFEEPQQFPSGDRANAFGYVKVLRSLTSPRSKNQPIPTQRCPYIEWHLRCVLTLLTASCQPYSHAGAADARPEAPAVPSVWSAIRTFGGSGQVRSVLGLECSVLPVLRQKRVEPLFSDREVHRRNSAVRAESATGINAPSPTDNTKNT